MRIYLVNPPAANGVKMVREGRCMQRKGAWTTVWPPVTLATMAAMFLRDGFEVKLSDCIVEDIDYGNLSRKISGFKPDLLVINTATASIYSDIYCAKLAKDIDPGIKTLAFGLHVTVLADETFESQPCLDYIIRGEPEFCLLDLAKALKNNYDLVGINGLSYRILGAIKHNANRGFDGDLNSLPPPAWELVDTKNYPLPLSEEPFLLITTSKGCPHSCIFCPAKPFYGASLRLRDYRMVVDEIAYVKNRFKVRQFLIWSESFTEEKPYVMALCNEIISRKLDIAWACNSRVDKVDRQTLKIMKAAGCWMIGYGVESGSQEILDVSNKGTTLCQIENAVNLAKEEGLEVTAHVIFGLPQETLKTGLATIKWLDKLDIDYAQIYCAVPWPSTQLYHIAKNNGWLPEADWSVYEQNNFILNMKTISPREVEYLRRRAMRKFYLSPKRILRVLRKIDSPRKAFLFLKMIKEFVTWM